MRYMWAEEVRQALRSINLPSRLSGNGGLVGIAGVPVRQELGAMPYREVIRRTSESVTEAELETIFSGFNRKNVFARFQGAFVTTDYAVDYGVSWALYYYHRAIGIPQLPPDKAKYDEPVYLNDSQLKQAVYAALRAARYAMTKAFVPDLKPVRDLRDSDIRAVGVVLTNFDSVWNSWLARKKREVAERSRGIPREVI